MEIMTVLGPIAPEQMGITQTHEHLLVDFYEFVRDYGAILDDEDVAVEELGYFKRAGGRGIVDVSMIDVGRNPLGLQRVARASGLHVIMSTGWYREASYPPYIQTMTADQLAEIMVRDLVEGADGTGVRAGLIGEIGTERGHITPAQERVFRSAARAQKQTGRAITTHCTRGELALEQLALLREEGVDPGRIIIGHMGDRRHTQVEQAVLRAGAYVQIDHIGFAHMQPDLQRARNIAELVRVGFADRILLSLDICLTSHLHRYGGRGYNHLLTSFVPLMKGAGIADEHIQAMLVDNPRRALAY